MNMTLPLFDAHCDTISRLWRQGSDCLAGGDGQWDLDRLDWAAPRAQIFALFCDSAQPGAREAMDAQYQTFLRACGWESGRIAFCRTGAEADAAFQSGKLAAFLSVEGAELLGCSI